MVDIAIHRLYPTIRDNMLSLVHMASIVGLIAGYEFNVDELLA